MEKPNYKKLYIDSMERGVKPPICFIDQSGLDRKVLKYLTSVGRPAKGTIRNIIALHNTALRLGELERELWGKR